MLMLLLVPTAALAVSAPINTSSPTVAGTAQLAQVLTADKGTWSGDPAPAFSYKWQRCEEGAVTSSTLATVGGGPRSIAIDSAGDLYVANNSANNVSKVTLDGYSFILGTAGSGTFGIALDPGGNVLATNLGSNNVTKISPVGNSTIFGTTQSYPVGITLDSAGNVYTADYLANKVTKITPGGSSSVLGSTGTSPFGIVVDPSGNVYTSNFASNNVTKITPGGVSTTYAVTDPGPRGLAIDPAGNLYASNDNGTITKILPGGASSTLGSTGGFAGWAIALDSAGNIYTSFSSSNFVTKMLPNGTSSVLGTTGSTPRGLVLAPGGVVYVVNQGSNTVTRIGPSLSCSDIPGATSQTYTVTGDDIGKKVRANVTAANGQGTLAANSAPTASVVASPQPPVNTAAPTISGEAKAGQRLTASSGSWTGYPEPSLSYQWQRCNADASSCANIGGATGNAYVIEEADRGARIRVVVTATNDQGAASKESNATDVVTSDPGPGPGPGPGPSPTPSNAFSISTASVGPSLVTKVEVPGPGLLTQAGTLRKGGRAARACITASRRVTRAGTYELICRPTSATRSARRRGAVAVRLCTAFRPENGTANSKCRIVVLPSARPRFTG